MNATVGSDAIWHSYCKAFSRLLASTVTNFASVKARTPADTKNKRNPAMALNQQTLEGNWNEIKGKLHERWGQLTQDDLQKARGNVDQLVGLIQRKTGEARERVEQYLNDLTSNGGAGVSKMAETVRGYASSAAESARGYASSATETA